MYQHVVHRISLQQVEVMFEDCFGLRVGIKEVLMIKALMARRYRQTCKGILARIVAGGLVHVDETEVNLQKGKGYVWVLASMEDVVYIYRPNREADFLRDLLRDFKGVLVSDFYPGYDSLPCEQQACLVHLIRDMNADLMGSPYDEEFKALAAEFGKLLRSIVGTIDKYGLKKRHLHKHKAEVARFFRDLAARVYRSELAEGYQKRLLKNEGRLFTFLDHDGVPWNNNAAEHAIKAFACFRELYDGQMSEEGLSDYLVLLSVQQTCKYRGVSFLKFLLSREEDVAAFRERRRTGNEPPALEVYPDGFSRTHRKTLEASRRRGRGPVMVVLLPTRPPGPHASDRKTTATQSTDGAPLGPTGSDVVAEAKAGDQCAGRRSSRRSFGWSGRSRSKTAGRVPAEGSAAGPASSKSARLEIVQRQMANP